MKHIVFLFLGLALVLQPSPPLGAAPQQEKPGATFSDQDFELALEFFRGGGTFSFRWIPESGPSKEGDSKWLILVLTPKDSTRRSHQLGAAVLGPKSSVAAAQKVSELCFGKIGEEGKRPDVAKEFLRRFADGIQRGEFTARLVVTPPIKGDDEVSASAAVTLGKKGLLELLK